MRFSFLQKSQTGFTLIELLVTIGIVGVLTAIAVPVYTGYQTDTKNTVANENASSIRKTIMSQLYTEGSVDIKDIKSVGLLIKGKNADECFNTFEITPKIVEINADWCFSMKDLKTECKQKIGENNDFCIDSKGKVCRGFNTECSGSTCKGGMNVSTSEACV